MTGNSITANNEAAGICAECGGDCCRTRPGICHPADFDNDAEKMKLAATSGRYAVDCYEGVEGSSYYIRPAVKGRENQAVHYAWEGECTFLAAGGCQLGFGRRPYGCRTLAPEPGHKCVEIFCGDECVRAWEDFQDAVTGWCADKL
jgi:hypothetical protein